MNTGKKQTVINCSNNENDQQIIISHGETISCSSSVPFGGEIKPSTYRPVSPTLYQLSYPARPVCF
jgi:hypothetical protein